MYVCVCVCLREREEGSVSGANPLIMELAERAQYA